MRVLNLDMKCITVYFRGVLDIGASCGRSEIEPLLTNPPRLRNDPYYVLSGTFSTTRSLDKSGFRIISAECEHKFLTYLHIDSLYT